jgi:hypothetical protein
MLWLALFVAFQLSRRLSLDAELIDALQWCAAIGRVLVPLGFLIALLQAKVDAG